MRRAIVLPSLTFCWALSLACVPEDRPQPQPKPKQDSGVVADSGQTQQNPDSGTQNGDAGTMINDDAGQMSTPDSGVSRPDSGTSTGNDAGTMGNDAGTMGSDAGTTTMIPQVGAACMGATCTEGTGSCLTGNQSWWDEPFDGGYCTVGSCQSAMDCGSNADCFQIDMAGGTTCLSTCQSSADCRQGYDCYDPGACLPAGMTMMGTGTSPIGGPCMVDGDCRDMGASCIPETGSSGATGWIGGYCTLFSCSMTTPCPTGSTCYVINSNNDTACLDDCMGAWSCRDRNYACADPGACLPACTANSCAAGEVCGPEGVCITAPCTAGSCAPGQRCDMASGQCVVDIGTAPAGPIPSCPNVPDWRCTGGEANCGQVVAFEPDRGPGYWDYPINGETSTNEYRSWIRRDVMALVKHAAASVDCLAANWTVGNGEPLGLGDMSEMNGAIPGTSVGSPGHPMGTHVDGHDMDVAYYQLTSADNRLRAICPHTQGGRDQYHCVSAPTNLDVWRTALFLGELHDSPQLRVIGVDGQAGPMIESALTQLCARGWLNNSACRSHSITYETTDMGRGWFRFHHHHFHLSLRAMRSNILPPDDGRKCLVADCRPAEHDHYDGPKLLQRTLPIRPLGEAAMCVFK